MVLIDTSALIEFLNQTESPASLAAERLISANADVALAAISITEILQGIRLDREYRQVKESLLSFPFLSLKGTESYVAAAELYRACRKKGLTIRGTIDLLIAQTAIENHACLLHNDRDFDALARISGLKIHRNL